MSSVVAEDMTEDATSTTNGCAADSMEPSGSAVSSEANTDPPVIKSVKRKTLLGEDATEDLGPVKRVLLGGIDQAVLETHSEDFSCWLCKNDTTFADISTLIEHYYLSHTAYLCCAFCFKQFPGPRSANEHYETAHCEGTADVTCYFCPVHFEDVRPYQRHVERSHSIEHFQLRCTICHVLRPTRYALQLHLEFNHDGRGRPPPVVIEETRRRIGYKEPPRIGEYEPAVMASLEKRMEDKFVCRVCSSTFTCLDEYYAHGLLEHEMGHFCGICGWTGTSEEVPDPVSFYRDRKARIMNHSCPTLERDETRSNRFYKGSVVCPFCGKPNDTLEGLHGHMCECHTAAYEQQQCRFCRGLMPSIKAVELHEDRMHDANDIPTTLTLPFSVHYTRCLIMEDNDLLVNVVNEKPEETDVKKTIVECGNMPDVNNEYRLARVEHRVINCSDVSCDVVLESLDQYVYHCMKVHGQLLFCSQCACCLPVDAVKGNLYEFGRNSRHANCIALQDFLGLRCPWCMQEFMSHSTADMVANLQKHCSESHADAYRELRCVCCQAIYPSARTLAIHRELLHSKRSIEIMEKDPPENMENDLKFKQSVQKRRSIVSHRLPMSRQAREEALERLNIEEETERSKLVYSIMSQKKHVINGEYLTHLHKSIGVKFFCHFPQCGMELDSLDAFYTHGVAIHNAPFFCDQCGVALTLQETENMTNFGRGLHENCKLPFSQALRQVPEREQRQCPVCGVPGTWSALRDHYRREHTTMWNNQACVVCLAVLPSPQCRAIHLHFCHTPEQYRNANTQAMRLGLPQPQDTPATDARPTSLMAMSTAGVGQYQALQFNRGLQGYGGSKKKKKKKKF